MKYIGKMLCILLLSLGLMGCGEKSYLQTGEKEQTKIQDMEEVSELADDTEQQRYYVQVNGAVNKPGVYDLPAGSRVCHAIKKAGGLREDACATELNQARVLTDGEMIYICTQQENEEKDKAEAEDGKININTADAEELTRLPGIGETRAQTIIQYRESHGLFSCPEDIKNVSGIGDSTYAKMAEAIKVN